MGTRSSIFIKATNTKGNTAYYRFYKHWDGYPTGNLSLIHKISALYYAVKMSIPKMVQLACTLDSQRAEYEGRKMSLNEIVSHNEHGDLEWTYVIDLDAKDVKIYTSQDGTSRAVIDDKTTNPLEYVKQLRQECQANEKYQIDTLVQSLHDIGFKVNGN